MRVRHLLLALAAAVSTGCAADPTASTGLAPSTQPSRIVSGVPDAGAHPYVGLLLFQGAPGAGTWLCSGALLSPTVVLTAGHCTDGAVAAFAIFAETLQPGVTVYPGTAHTYADFCTGCGNGLPRFARGDVGVVTLAQPVPTGVVGTYAQLPTAGLVDALGRGAAVDLVGYGVQHQLVGGGPPQWDWIDGRITRRRAPAELVSDQFVHSATFLRASANAAQGKGGICFGDSGGPDLVGGTNVVLAVNSYVTNTNCTGVTYSYRVDTPAVLAWVGSFL